MEFNYFYEHLITIPLIALFVTILFKEIWIISTTGKMDIKRAFWSGGMPSVHSAIVVSIAMAIALKYWFFYDFFATVIWFTIIIIYDAINVRYEAWLHAKAINQTMWEKRFKESLWHLPSEAFVGSVTGILVALIMFYI